MNFELSVIRQLSCHRRTRVLHLVASVTCRHATMRVILRWWLLVSETDKIMAPLQQVIKRRGARGNFASHASRPTNVSPVAGRPSRRYRSQTQTILSVEKMGLVWQGDSRRNNRCENGSKAIVEAKTMSIRFGD